MFCSVLLLAEEELLLSRTSGLATWTIFSMELRFDRESYVAHDLYQLRAPPHPVIVTIRKIRILLTNVQKIFPLHRLLQGGGSSQCINKCRESAGESRRESACSYIFCIDCATTLLAEIEYGSSNNNNNKGAA